MSVLLASGGPLHNSELLIDIAAFKHKGFYGGVGFSIIAKGQTQ